MNKRIFVGWSNGAFIKQLLEDLIEQHGPPDTVEYRNDDKEPFYYCTQCNEIRRVGEWFRTIDSDAPICPFCRAVGSEELREL